MTAPLRRPPRHIVERLARPVREFLEVESSGGIVLLVATLAALVWANSPWDGSYARLWHTELAVRVGDFELREDLRHWVNDALMAVFFFVVGLEIKRELVAGELREVRAAALPALAAVGGMVVPALVYAAFNAGGAGSDGWGVPMATDIAFALGVVALLGSRVPSSLKVFLLALAIVDDIGAIVVIAIFYTGDLSVGWLATAVLLVGVVVLTRWLGVWYHALYFALGIGLWVATFESGIHATLAGVAMGLLAPARPLADESLLERVVDRLRSPSSPSEVRRTASLVREQVSVVERLEAALHPWTSYVVIPIFALANAGIVLSGDVIGDAASSAITLGVVLGLIVGKLVGITSFAWLATRLGVGRLPEGTTWPQIAAIALIAGIGFTVAIFVAGLAFEDAAVQDEAKIGILAASVVAAVAGALALRAATPQADRNAGS